MQLPRMLSESRVRGGLVWVEGSELPGRRLDSGADEWRRHAVKGGPASLFAEVHSAAYKASFA